MSGPEDVLTAREALSAGSMTEVEPDPPGVPAGVRQAGKKKLRQGLGQA